MTPDMVRTRVAEGCGFNPRGEATQTFLMDPRHADGAGPRCLVATAEIPLAGEREREREKRNKDS